MSDHSPAAAARAIDARRLGVLAVVLVLALTALTMLARPRQADAVDPPADQLARPRLRFARAMLVLLNAERHAHKLRPLTMSPRLRRSAHRHNLNMARADEMSHQLPHEAYFGRRISDTGYRWSAAGENIGWNGLLTKGGVLALERLMYGEVPPNDGAPAEHPEHRLPPGRHRRLLRREAPQDLVHAGLRCPAALTDHLTGAIEGLPSRSVIEREGRSSSSAAAQPQTAPCAAEPTSLAYLPSTP